VATLTPTLSRREREQEAALWDTVSSCPRK